MSDSDQNTNAITEQQRREQLANLNLNVDESITAVDDSEDVLPIDHINSLKNKNDDSEVHVANETIFNGQDENGEITDNFETFDKLQATDVSNEILEDVVDDISNGIVADFSKNIATYVTEVCKFDEKYEREQNSESSETHDKESASSGSETNENFTEKATLQNVEQLRENKDESNSQHLTTDNQEVNKCETTAINPDSVKENDVKDECVKVEKTEKKDGEEGEDGYLDLLGNGLLKRKVLEGVDVEDIKPYHGEVVTVNTSGRLQDGSIVDSLTEFTFYVGEGDVIQAWDLGVMTTKVGQTIELITDPKYAYGELGRDPDIPPNATITYTIKLIKKDEAPDLHKLDIDERLSMGEQKRERGNTLFTRNDFAGAINSYNKALKILESGSLQGTPEKLQTLADCRLKCSNNMAACQLKVEAYDAAIKSCLCVLDLQPDNVKALFRIGKAYTAKGETKNGIQYLQKALKLEPDSKVIKQEIRKLSQKISKETELEKDMYKKMLGTKTRSTPEPFENKNKSWKSWAFAGGAVAALVAAGLAAYRYGHH